MGKEYQETQDKKYLGDSVYIAKHSSGMFVLTTENGEQSCPSNIIYIEPFMVKDLIEYFESSRKTI